MITFLKIFSSLAAPQCEDRGSDLRHHSAVLVRASPRQRCHTGQSFKAFRLFIQSTVSLTLHYLSEPEFVNVQGAQKSIPPRLCSLTGRYDKQGYPTGPPGYIGWRYRFLGINSGLLISLKIRAQRSVATGPLYFVFSRLYPSSPPQPRQCLAPTCHLSTLS